MHARDHGLREHLLVELEPFRARPPGAEGGARASAGRRAARRAARGRRGSSARARSPRLSSAQTWRGPTTSRLAAMSEATTTTSRAKASSRASDWPSQADQCRQTVASPSRSSASARGSQPVTGMPAARSGASSSPPPIQPTRASLRERREDARAGGRPAGGGDPAHRDDDGLRPLGRAPDRSPSSSGMPLRTTATRGACSPLRASSASASDTAPSSALRRATSASTPRTTAPHRRGDARAREREAVRGVDQRDAARDGQRADRARRTRSAGARCPGAARARAGAAPARRRPARPASAGSSAAGRARRPPRPRGPRGRQACRRRRA